MKKLSKIISMLMAFALVMGLALTPALAAELTTDCFTETMRTVTNSDGSTKTVTENVLKESAEAYTVSRGELDLSSLSGNIVVKSNATINMAEGATLSLGKNNIRVENATLTVNGAGSEDGGSKITSTGTVIDARNGATVKAEDVSFSSQTEYGAYVGFDSTAEFKDCKMTSQSGKYAVAITKGSKADFNDCEIEGGKSGLILNGAEAKLTDTTVEGKDGFGLELGWNNYHNPYSSTATIIASEVTGTNAAIYVNADYSQSSDPNQDAVNNGTVTIVSGTVNGNIVEKTVDNKNGEQVELTNEGTTGTTSEHVKIAEGSVASMDDGVLTVTVPQPPVYNLVVQNETNAEIEDEDVPLAGIVTVKDLLGYLYEREGYELPAAPEDSNELYDFTPAIEWAVEAKIVDEDVDPDALLTVGVAEDILNAYAAVFASKPDLGFVIDGADDDIVDDIAAVLKDFLAKLKG